MLDFPAGDVLVYWSGKYWGSKKVIPFKASSFVTLQKTNMAMGNPPFEDVFPVENGDFPASHVSFQECFEKNTPLPFKTSLWPPRINLKPLRDISRNQLSVDLTRGLYLSHFPNTAVTAWLEWNLRWFCFHEVSSFVIISFKFRWFNFFM